MSVPCGSCPQCLNGVESECVGISVEAFAVGYLVEFDDDGGPERFVARIADEFTATRTARALERLGALPYSGSRPVLYGTVFTCPVSSLGADGVVSALWADGPKVAIARSLEPLEEKEDDGSVPASDR